MERLKCLDTETFSEYIIGMNVSKGFQMSKDIFAKGTEGDNLYADFVAAKLKLIRHLKAKGISDKDLNKFSKEVNSALDSLELVCL